MLTRPLLLALLAACGVNSSGAPAGPPHEQPEKKPPDDIEKDYIFCCQSVDTQTKSGDGCVTIGENQIDSCSTVLACADGFTKQDGTVTCT
ncbi:hypothetical protein DB30_05050 [Enhygromyxa salina]|uniref:Uncharacterized protein n=1 Tax=Enhygromyxa salina TaxID=215803 RepID=A0A0C2CYD0_9BACT|nr:hypothetical protein [Enhygromyxa salina]KIG15996.1 hypothetical protein DB30_05050 [Enhygromyxa salina]